MSTSLRKTIGVLIAYALLALLLFHDAWRSPGSTIAGAGNDPGMFAWYLRWTPWALIHGSDPLLTDRIVAPEGANLMWNTSVILPAAVLSPLTLLASPLLTYNVLATLAPALSAAAAFAALRRHASTLAAAAGGMLYGFSPTLTMHARGQVMLSLAAFPPLAMMLIEDIITAGDRRRRRRAAVWLGLAATAQLLTSSELLAITAIGAAVGLGALALLQRRRTRDNAAATLRALGLAGVTFAITAALPLAVLLLGPQRPAGALQPQNVFVQDLAGLIVPGPGQLVSPGGSAGLWDRFTGNPLESSGYLGIPLCVLLVISAWRCRRQSVARWSAMVTAALVVLSLGPALHVAGRVTAVPLPFRPLQAIPLLASLEPGRFMIPAFLPAALLLALLIDDAARSARRAPALLGVPLCTAAAAVVLTLLPRAVPATAIDTPGFFTTASVERITAGDVVLVVASSDSVAMVWQAEAGMRFRVPSGRVFVPMPEPPYVGYLGPPPSPVWTEIARFRSGAAPSTRPAEDRDAVLDDMRRIGVSDVIVGPGPFAGAAVAYFTALFERPPDRDGGVALWVRVSPADAAPAAGG